MTFFDQTSSTEIMIGYKQSLTALPNMEGRNISYIIWRLFASK